MKEETRFKIIRDREYYSHFNQYLTGESAMEFRNFFNEKKYKLPSGFLTYRTISHWESLGLFKNNREKDLKWRNYSVSDIVWLYIAKEIRRFGVGLEEIAKAKKGIWGYNTCEYAPMEFYLALCLRTRHPCEVLFFYDSDIEFALTNEIEHSKESFGALPPYLSINLNYILDALFPNANLKPSYDPNLLVSDKDLEILQAIRSGLHSHVTVRIKDKKPDILETVTTYSPKEVDIHELIKKSKHHTVTTETADGKMHRILFTEKEKL